MRAFCIGTPEPHPSEEYPVRLHTRIVGAVSAVALTLGTAVVASAPAHASTDTDAAAHATTPASSARFDGVSISGLKKKQKLPVKNGRTRTVNFTVNITGSPSDGGVTDINGDGLSIDYKVHDADFKGASIVSLKSRVKKKARTLPRLNVPTTVSPGANTFSIGLHNYVSPGRYEVRIPITQNNWTDSPRVSTTKVATFRINVQAPKKLSRNRTSYYAPSWRTGAAAKFTINAPSYKRGAKVTLFYRTANGKKFTKIASKKLKAKGTSSIATAKINTKKLRPGHRFYFKVSKNKWAPGYKTKTDRVVRR